MSRYSGSFGQAQALVGNSGFGCSGTSGSFGTSALWANSGFGCSGTSGSFGTSGTFGQLRLRMFRYFSSFGSPQGFGICWQFWSLLALKAWNALVIQVFLVAQPFESQEMGEPSRNQINVTAACTDKAISKRCWRDVEYEAVSRLGLGMT
ncbi:hypothetical protein CUMW_246270 [Citrus unshiu]|uniref:Uncharacterized protein n=1 Tax=Citrus unshiu TaxID=55188 RepID=A0A2H5QNC3_CITUN|nr:hypothetical protein CUMW_246270 [Citrus unshiu]